MKKLIQYLGVTAVVVSAGCLFVMAADRPDLSVIRHGDVYNHQDMWKNVENAVKLMPIAIDSVSVNGGGRESGPVATPPASKGSSMTQVQGASAIPGTNAGSFLSPQERTSLSVKKAIRHLG